MKILMLTPYLPYPLLSGGQIRTYNLLKKLANQHDITLFSLIKDEQERQHITELESFCHKVKVFKRSKRPFTTKNILKTAFSSYPFLVMRNHVPETIKAVEQELATYDYDLIHAETFYMMPHIPQTNIPTILVEQTIEYLGYESYAGKTFWPLKLLLNIDIAKIKRWERHYWHKADRLITMSQDDRHYIQEYLQDKSKVKVVSNGVDTDWFDQIKRQEQQHPTILYVGTFKWLPNIEAAQFLVEKVWPLIKAKQPQAQLKIVGNAPTNKIKSYQNQDPRIEVTGRVPDIRHAFKQADVLVAPVFSGKGTRYKILEAMACRTPIVASKTAVEGLNVENKQQVLVANQPKKMAHLTNQLLTNKKLWHKLAKNGHQFVKGHYDWQIISKKLDNIYQSLG